MRFLKFLKRILPTVLTAVIFAIIVWITAISDADPNRESTLDNPTKINVIGLNPNLLLVNPIPEWMNLTVRAPSSLITRLNLEPDLVKITLDLSGLEAGMHTLEPQIDILVIPVDIINTSIDSIEVELEQIATVEFPINLTLNGSLPVGYQAENPTVHTENVIITGPKSLVDTVTQVVAIIDISNAVDSVDLMVDLTPINAAGGRVNDISLSPNKAKVTVDISQLGGYRNLFVKIVTNGQIANGFYLTGLSATPVTVTVFSSNPELVNSMPAYVETTPINLNGVSEPYTIEASLNLPDGIELVGEKTVLVQVDIAPIQSSINFLNVPIQVINIGAVYTATLSPSTVDVYLSGPLYLLEKITISDIIINLELSDRGVGTYQLSPFMKLIDDDIKVDAILPGTIEVIIKRK